MADPRRARTDGEPIAPPAVRIGNWTSESAVLIVAEVGNNHEGNVHLAEELVGLAAASGADVVKFQTFSHATGLVAPGQTERIAQLERFRLAPEDFERLAAAAAREGIMFLSTPLDLPAVSILDALVPAFKIASGDNNFVPLLEAVASTGKPVLLSTGLANLDEIERSVLALEAVWSRDGTDPGVVLLHCVVSYPAAPQDANLGALQDLKRLGLTVGYSDHTIGIDAVVLAVAAGARVVEKHFTIDNEYSSFRDHRLSADPKAMTLLVERVRETEVLLGTGRKEPQACEESLREAVRRSIVAARDLAEGTTLTMEDLTWVRPAGGLPPGEEHNVIGRRLLRSVSDGETIYIDDVEPA